MRESFAGMVASTLTTSGFAGLCVVAALKPTVTLNDVDLVLTGLFAFSLVALVAGLWLFVVVFRGGTKLQRDIERLLAFHREGFAIYTDCVTTTTSDPAMVAIASNEWSSKVIDWLERWYPAFTVNFLRGRPRKTFFGLVNYPELAKEANVLHGRLDAIQEMLTDLGSR